MMNVLSNARIAAVNSSPVPGMTGADIPRYNRLAAISAMGMAAISVTRLTQKIPHMNLEFSFLAHCLNLNVTAIAAIGTASNSEIRISLILLLF